jgi:serine/threonine protein kinase
VEYFNNSNKKLDFEIAKFIHYKIMFGLMELNFSGIIHGDLKPENIIISIYKQSSKKVKKNAIMNLEEIVSFILKEESKVNGIENIKKNINVKIIDFNKSVYSKTALKPLDIQTIYYTPPEIIAGNYYYNNSVDIWTVSCILFEMLSNIHLFNIYNKSQLSENTESSKDISENSKETSECSSSNNSIEEEQFDHLALLHMYNYLLGSYPQELLVNCKYKDIYFTNGALNGRAGFGSNNISHLFKFNNFFNEILLRTFKYDHRERLTIEEYFDLYVRN